MARLATPLLALAFRRIGDRAAAGLREHLHAGRGAMTCASRAAVIADQALELTVVGSFSRVGFAARRALFAWDATPQPDLRDRTVVITGATGGLGLAAAHLLAARGARLGLIGRDAGRTEAARRSVVDATPDARVDTVVADLASLDAVRSAADRLGELLAGVDVLVHNAGALVHERRTTEDGLELTAQVHVVAPFLLTTRLLPLLRASADGRVIFVSSGGMYTRRLDVDALEHPPEPFDGVRAYADAKRAAGRADRPVGASSRRARHRLPRDAPRVGRHAGRAGIAARVPPRHAPAPAIGGTGRRHHGVAGRRARGARDERRVLARSPAPGDHAAPVDAHARRRSRAALELVRRSFRRRRPELEAS